MRLRRARGEAGGARAVVILSPTAGSIRIAWRVLENSSACVRSRRRTRSRASSSSMYFEEEQKLRPTVLAAEAQPDALRPQRALLGGPAGPGSLLDVPAAGRRRASRSRSFRSRSRAGPARCCARRPGARSELKWPNDLYVGRRKLAGVLAESRTQGERDRAWPSGIGINVLGRAAKRSRCRTPRPSKRRPAGASPLARAAAGAARAARPRSSRAPRWERRDPAPGSSPRSIGRATALTIRRATAKRSRANTSGSILGLPAPQDRGRGDDGRGGRGCAW